MDVFTGQRFVLQSVGRGFPKRIELNLREILTGSDEPFFFDYPHEYLNSAALALCVALTQVALEPQDGMEWSERFKRPLSETEFDRAILPHRDAFEIEGKSPFLQGIVRGTETKPLSELFPTVKINDKYFLNRMDKESVVRVDQVPLLLFGRSTFYEKSAGKGYLTGTSGDLEIRTWLRDPASLRRTIWLNVMTAEMQKQYSGRYALPGDAGYNDWMWINPPASDVPEGTVSLRSGLFWMVASLRIQYETLRDPGVCIVTGDVLPADTQVGSKVAVTSTHCGYGIKQQSDGGGPAVRRSFFLHPCAPWALVAPKKGPPFWTHYAAEEVSGLIGQMAGLFFFTPDGMGQVAPVVEQLYQHCATGYFDSNTRSELQLECAGFQMLSSKKNIHGGYSRELFSYPVVGDADGSYTEANRLAYGLLHDCSVDARTGMEYLSRAIQLCTMVEVEATEKEGRLSMKPKKSLDAEVIAGNQAREFWRLRGSALRRLLLEIGQRGMRSESLADAVDGFLSEWRLSIGKDVLALFAPVFDDYSSSPQHIAASFKARSELNFRLRKSGFVQQSGNIKTGSGSVKPEIEVSL